MMTPHLRTCRPGLASGGPATARALLVGIVLAGLLSAGCSRAPTAGGPPPVTAADSSLAEVEASTPDAQDEPAPPDSAAPAVTTPAPVPVPAARYSPAPTPRGERTSPAARALIDDARALRDAGQLERASATLERAVRVQPYCAEAWLELARVRLTQRRYDEATSLATKARQLAGGQARIVAAAREILTECAERRRER